MVYDDVPIVVVDGSCTHVACARPGDNGNSRAPVRLVTPRGGRVDADDDVPFHVDHVRCMMCAVSGNS